MAEAVNAMIKVKNADKEGVDQFITERFNDVFGSARLKPLENGKVSYKGGSCMKPYGFKALSTVQLTPDGSAIVKLWGRPTMYPLAYLALLLLFGGVIGVIINPIEHGFIAILIVLFMFLLRREQKLTKKKINQVLDEVKVRF